MRRDGKDKATARTGKGATSYSGWLVKRGGFNKGWKKRWFTYKQARMTRMENGTLGVRKPSIQYFLSPENTKAKGKILLEEIINVTPASNNHLSDIDCLQLGASFETVVGGITYKYGFNIVTAERTYYISAQFADDMLQWLRILYSAPKLRRKLTQVNFLQYLPRRSSQTIHEYGPEENCVNDVGNDKRAVGIEEVLISETNYYFANACILGASLPRDGLLKEGLAYTMMAVLSDNGENVTHAEAFLEGLLNHELSTTTSPGMVFRTDTNATRFIVAYISHLCRTNGIGGFFHEVMDEAIDEITAISSTDDIDIDRKHLLSSSLNDFVDEEVINSVLEQNAIRLAGVIDGILDRALQFVPGCIGALRGTFERIVRTVRAKFPGYEYVGLSNIFVLRVMAGPLMNFGWNDNFHLHPKQQRFLALTTKLLNSISISVATENKDDSNSVSKQSEGYFFIMHQFYPALQSKMARFLHEMAVQENNPHSPMRRRKLIWHVPDDISIFRSFVYQQREMIRLYLLSSVLIRGQHDKYGRFFTALLSYLESDMRLTWDLAKKGTRLGHNHNKPSPFRTTSQKKLRYSLLGPAGNASRGKGGNDNNKKAARMSLTQRLVTKISSSSPRRLSYTTSRSSDIESLSDTADHVTLSENSLLASSSAFCLPKLQTDPIKSQDQPIGTRKYHLDEFLQTTIRNDMTASSIENVQSVKDEPGYWEQDEDEGDDQETVQQNATNDDVYIRMIDLGFLGRTWVTEGFVQKIESSSTADSSIKIMDKSSSHVSTTDMLKVNPVSKVSKWNLNPIRTARQKVSLKKNRFIHDGFDLDLSYITNKVIAMGFPCEGTQSLYRNSLTDTIRFFNYYHKDCYMIYNLCQEREYDCKKFDGRVVRFPFADHNACPLPMVLQFTDHAKNFLEKNPENVVAIHCKAGKGRTGMFISCLLASTGLTSADAMKIYAHRRTANNQGVTIPSQRIYVELFKQYCSDVVGYNNRLKAAKSLKQIDLHGMVLAKEDYVFFQVLTPSYHHGYEGSTVPLPESDEIILYDSRLEVGLVECDKEQINLTIGPLFGVSFVGDIRLVVYKVQNGSPKKVFQSWINSAFLGSNQLIRPKRELDGAVKDQKNKKFHRDFYIRCIFDDMYVEDEFNGDLKGSSIADVNTKGPLKEEAETIDEGVTEMEDAEKVNAKIEDPDKTDTNAMDADNMDEIGKDATDAENSDENEETQTPFFDLEGEHKEEHGHLGGDALVQQFLKKMDVEYGEENDSIEEQENLGLNSLAMEKGSTKDTTPPPPPPPPQIEEKYSTLVEDSQGMKTLSFASERVLPKRKNQPRKTLGLEHLAEDIQFSTSPISIPKFKFDSPWNAHADIDEDLRKSLRETTTTLVRRRISKRSSPIRQAMLNSVDDDDLWLAKRISYQMPHGSDKSATHATIKLRKKKLQTAKAESKRSPRGVAYTSGRGRHLFHVPLIVRTKPKRIGRKSRITAVDYGKPRSFSKLDLLNKSFRQKQSMRKLRGSPTSSIDLYHLTKKKMGSLSTTINGIYR